MNPDRIELGNAIYDDGTVSMNQYFKFESHQRLDDIHSYLHALPNRSTYTVHTDIKNREVRVSFFCDYFEHIILHPELAFDYTGSEEE
mgnify:FL=1|tara:strand:- start:113 stop:376 length:264 start_codon:yes stop_codon:yes gene_type:complete